MGYKKISVVEFLEQATQHPVLDVRSPGEYVHAHIPSAYSLPLFTDEERKIVGTAYKQESREKAIKHGLDFFGTKMVKMVEEVEKIVGSHESAARSKSYGDKTGDSLLNTHNSVLIHCWRGGMRSAAVAWLLDMYGFEVYTLDGGYKAFRNWVLQEFEREYPFKIIGGYTGSGKTELLTEMKKSGETVVDLEALANHKGSAFGGINQGMQPSAEMFENKLAIELNNAGSTSTETIWLEDESQRIGNINIPIELWKTMRSKPVIFLNIPFEERLENILKCYGKADKEKLVNAVIRIKKRLGGMETKAAVNFLLEDDLKESFRILLSYYDRWYRKGLESRENWQELVTEIDADRVDSAINAQLILASKRKEQNV